MCKKILWKKMCGKINQVWCYMDWAAKNFQCHRMKEEMWEKSKEEWEEETRQSVSVRDWRRKERNREGKQEIRGRKWSRH